MVTTFLCVNKFNSTQKSNFDTIIIDVNVGDYDVIEIVKKLLQNIPRQKIVFTTTADLYIIKDEMIRQGLSSSITILRKPFSFLRSACSYISDKR